MVKRLQKMAEKKAAAPAGLLDSQLAQTVKDSAQQIWLAGLGAFAKAQGEGGKVFDTLIKEGVSLQRKTQAVAEEKLGDVAGKMSAMAGEVGSSACVSELRAILAVPSAESPSTMNSSDRSVSADLQSTSFAGSAEDSRAFLRRVTSRCWRAASLARDEFMTLSRAARALSLAPRGGFANHSVSCLATTCETIREAAGVPSTSLVWPSN